MPNRSCEGCQAPISSTHGRPKWCDVCRIERRREKDRRHQKAQPRTPFDLTRPCDQCREPMVVGSANKRRFCNECRLIRLRTSDRARQSARRAANGHTEKYRNWTLLKRYGITREQYDDLLKAQNSCCAICKSKSPGSKSWHVDHDHSTGRVRGILCESCNHLLGKAKDSRDILSAAIDYLDDRTNERLAS